MPAQYALAYYLGSTILGSVILSVLVILLIHIPNGTFYLAGAGFVFFISCGRVLFAFLDLLCPLRMVDHQTIERGDAA